MAWLALKKVSSGRNGWNKNRIFFSFFVMSVSYPHSCAGEIEAVLQPAYDVMLCASHKMGRQVESREGKIGESISLSFFGAPLCKRSLHSFTRIIIILCRSYPESLKRFLMDIYIQT